MGNGSQMEKVVQSFEYVVTIFGPMTPFANIGAL